MLPIAICRHEAAQGPGYLQTFLTQHAIPHRLFAIDAGDTPPRLAGEFSAVVILGSNASVNDNLAWIGREESLLRDALRLDRPVLGHCFGGQLLAKAMGARVRRNAVPHIGWGKVRTTSHPEARQWFGSHEEVEMFHWHFDTFAIPQGARRILYGSCCLNKGYSFGPHLGLQSHLEVTADSVRLWCEEDRAGLEEWQHLPTVQSEAQILYRIDERIARLHRLADQVYLHWLAGIPGALSQWSQALGRPHGGPSWQMVLAR